MKLRQVKVSRYPNGDRIVIELYVQDEHTHGIVGNIEHGRISLRRFGDTSTYGVTSRVDTEVSNEELEKAVNAELAKWYAYYRTRDAEGECWDRHKIGIKNLPLDYLFVLSDHDRKMIQTNSEVNGSKYQYWTRMSNVGWNYYHCDVIYETSYRSDIMIEVRKAELVYQHIKAGNYRYYVTNHSIARAGQYVLREGYAMITLTYALYHMHQFKISSQEQYSKSVEPTEELERIWELMNSTAENQAIGRIMLKNELWKP